jgi:CRP-like cAMP-binding protein
VCSFRTQIVAAIMQRSNTYGTANRLLAALPTQARQEFIAECDVVDLEFGSVLREAGQRVDYAYFPMAGIVSLVSRLDDGARIEVGIVGNEGMLGTALVFGMETCAQDLVVQSLGSAWRIKASAFSRALAANAALQRTLNRYTYVLLSQLGQTAACTHFHDVESRLARLLLLTRDRAQSNSFFLTHEFIASMLGARRAGITHAASALRERGLIRYSRGDVRVLNSAGLEKASCGCYRRSTRIYADVFGAPTV